MDFDLNLLRALNNFILHGSAFESRMDLDDDHATHDFPPSSCLVSSFFVEDACLIDNDTKEFSWPFFQYQVSSTQCEWK